jgi:hypothetical protein
MPLIAHVIDGQLVGAEEQHRLLLQAKPGSLNDATVERVVQVPGAAGPLARGAADDRAAPGGGPAGPAGGA